MVDGLFQSWHVLLYEMSSALILLTAIFYSTINSQLVLQQKQYRCLFCSMRISFMLLYRIQKQCIGNAMALKRGKQKENQQKISHKAINTSKQRWPSDRLWPPFSKHTRHKGPEQEVCQILAMGYRGMLLMSIFTFSSG